MMTEINNLQLLLIKNKMDNSDYQKATDFAKKNLAQIEELLPDFIKKREADLFNKILNAKGNNFTKLKFLYHEMDIIYKFLDKITICKKGCSYCCHYDVAISEIEVEFILNNTKARRVNYENALASASDSCPFLKENKCAIYPYRPFLCRRHVSIVDSCKWCKQDVCKKYEFPLLYFTEVDKSYAYLWSSSFSGHMYDDIRNVFRTF